MREDALRAHRLQNGLHSAVLVLAMAAMLGALGYYIGGGFGIVLSVLMLALAAFSQSLTPRFVLRLFGARRLSAHEAPALFEIVRMLSERAGLERPPELHYIPSPVMNAFAVGGESSAAIGVTDGLLRGLTTREVACVLAHEISHVRNGDTFVMGLADAMSRLTESFSIVGQLWLFLSLPLLLAGVYTPPFLFVFLLVFAPFFSALLQRALSRTREFDADLHAAEITGDPEGLASALIRLERVQRGLFERILFPGRRIPEPSLLRTHPPTEERVRRLLELRGREHTRPWEGLARQELYTGEPVVRRPRWRWFGSYS